MLYCCALIQYLIQNRQIEIVFFPSKSFTDIFVYFQVGKLYKTNTEHCFGEASLKTFFCCCSGSSFELSKGGRKQPQAIFQVNETSQTVSGEQIGETCSESFAMFPSSFSILSDIINKIHLCFISTKEQKNM